MLSEEEKKAIEYFKEKIINKLPLYEETYIDGKPYRRNILQLETNFTEEQANKTETLLNLIKNQQKEIEKQEKQIIKLSNIKLYACDENKNKKCNKKHCYINGGECEATTDMTKVKYINLDNYIHKDKIRNLFDIAINEFIDKEGLIVKILKQLRQELLEEEIMNEKIKCEYCKEGEGKSILHDEEYDSLNIFIKNGLLWEKTNDMGIIINYCPICGRKLGD